MNAMTLENLLDRYEKWQPLASAGRSAQMPTRERGLGRWRSYAAAVSAALVAPAASEAAIVYSGVQNLSISFPASTVLPIYMDGLGPQVIFNLQSRTNGVGAFASARFGGYGPNGLAFAGTSGGNLLTPPLSSGAVVGTGTFGPFSSYNILRTFQGGVPARGSWNPSSTAFVGVKFYRGPVTTTYSLGTQHFGWIRVHFSADASGANQLTVIDWAWEGQPGVPIIAGAIPEPSSLALGGLGLLALGAAGVRHYRKQKK